MMAGNSQLLKPNPIKINGNSDSSLSQVSSTLKPSQPKKQNKPSQPKKQNNKSSPQRKKRKTSHQSN